jgi:hypothetical protein
MRKKNFTWSLNCVHLTHIIKSYKEYRLKIRFFIDQWYSLDTFSISLGCAWKKLYRCRYFFTKSCVFTKHVAKWWHLLFVERRFYCEKAFFPEKCITCRLNDWLLFYCQFTLLFRLFISSFFSRKTLSKNFFSFYQWNR